MVQVRKTVMGLSVESSMSPCTLPISIPVVLAVREQSSAMPSGSAQTDVPLPLMTVSVSMA